MSVTHIPFAATGYFSKLICDYLDKKPELSQFYGNFPDVAGFKNQLASKKTAFTAQSRNLLVDALKNQYKNTTVSQQTNQNIALLSDENTFTAPPDTSYFLYKFMLNFLN